jgi:hypothetical protein
VPAPATRAIRGDRANHAPRTGHRRSGASRGRLPPMRTGEIPILGAMTPSSFSVAPIMPLLFRAERHPSPRLWTGLWITFRVSFRPCRFLPITETRKATGEASPLRGRADGLPLFLKADDRVWGNVEKSGHCFRRTAFSGAIRPTARSISCLLRFGNVRYFLARRIGAQPQAPHPRPRAAGGRVGLTGMPPEDRNESQHPVLTCSEAETDETF